MASYYGLQREPNGSTVWQFPDETERDAWVMAKSTTRYPLPAEDVDSVFNSPGHYVRWGAPTQHGGSRKGAGRKPLAETVVKITVKLSPEQREKFHALGGSDWLRNALERWDEIQALLAAEDELEAYLKK